MAKISISAVKIKSHADGTQPKDPQAIFVFGSNTAGQHWGGAAKAAELHFGAQTGKAIGISGRSYAIPTVEVDLDASKGERGRRTLSISEIKHHVDKFKRYVEAHPDKTFFLTRLGCVIAGHSDKDIAPLFAPAQSNCDYPQQWVQYLKG